MKALCTRVPCTPLCTPLAPVHAPLYPTSTSDKTVEP